MAGLSPKLSVTMTLNAYERNPALEPVPQAQAQTTPAAAAIRRPHVRKSPNIRLIAVSLLAVLCLVLGVLGCGSVSSTTLAPSAPTTVKPVPATTTTTEVVVLDLLSTFDAKDPFIQQAVSTSTTKAGTTTTKVGGTTTTKSGTTSTTGSGTTSTTGSGSSTTTTASSRHSMKALSISTTNGVSTATIEVDDVVYQNNGWVTSSAPVGGSQDHAHRCVAQSVTVLHAAKTVCSTWTGE